MLKKVLVGLVMGVGVAKAAGLGVAGLACDPVPTATSYVWYGLPCSAPTPHNFETASQVTSTAPAINVTGLDECQDWCFVAKARNSVGLSASFSNEVQGWPRPRIATVTPSTAAQGDTVDLLIQGGNFKPGATVLLNSPGVTTQVALTNVTVTGCGQITGTVTIPLTAAVGSWQIEVTNPDRYYGTGGAVQVGGGTLPASPVNLKIVPRKNP